MTITTNPYTANAMTQVIAQAERIIATLTRSLTEHEARCPWIGLTHADGLPWVDHRGNELRMGIEAQRRLIAGANAQLAKVQRAEMFARFA